MALISTNDLEYQPKIANSLYVNTKLKKRYKIKLFTLFLIITTFIVLLLGYFLALNYFRIISLSHISTVFDILPISPYETEDTIKNIQNQSEDEISVVSNNTFAIEGTFDGFDEDGIKIKTNSKKVLKFELGSEVTIRNVSENNNQSTFMFTSDLLQKENIGRKIRVEFTKKDNKNLLITVEIDWNSNLN